MSQPTQSEFYEHCRMFFCMGCEDKGEDEEGCEYCPVSDVPLDPEESKAQREKNDIRQKSER